MKERIFTTKEQGRVLVEAGLPISTAIGFRDKYLDSLHSMEDDAGRIGLIEAVTPDISDPVWDVGTLLSLLPKELIVIDRFYPSSKTCSRCGWKNKDLKLSDRTFVCKDCGMEIDRDLNAAINIQAVGVDAAIRTQSSRVASCVEASKME